MQKIKPKLWIFLKLPFKTLSKAETVSKFSVLSSLETHCSKQILSLPQRYTCECLRYKYFCFIKTKECKQLHN